MEHQISITVCNEDNLRNLLVEREREKTIDETEAKLQAIKHSSAPNLSIDIQSLINERFNKIEESIDKLVTKKLNK